ncbi:hypothetical protein NP493_2g16025 [Ridgeia piscesae]|uniref:Uncharacterized protein n=1 Tax=Ridgeia piscesae TaxID=27915 RepID=A0AAD9PGK6_RIDPI|nr:hypothetical protein NP493_2g16025 [Ridgeia piscesae]
MVITESYLKVHLKPIRACLYSALKQPESVIFVSTTFMFLHCYTFYLLDLSMRTFLCILVVT